MRMKHLAAIRRQAVDNIRNLYIDNETTPVTIWFGNNHGAGIVKLLD